MLAFGSLRAVTHKWHQAAAGLARGSPTHCSELWHNPPNTTEHVESGVSSFGNKGPRTFSSFFPLLPPRSCGFPHNSYFFKTFQGSSFVFIVNDFVDANQDLNPTAVRWGGQHVLSQFPCEFNR